MPKPIVLTAYFQVTNVDISIQCVVSSLFFSKQSIEKTGDRTKTLKGNYLLARAVPTFDFCLVLDF